MTDDIVNDVINEYISRDDVKTVEETQDNTPENIETETPVIVSSEKEVFETAQAEPNGTAIVFLNKVEEIEKLQQANNSELQELNRRFNEITQVETNGDTLEVLKKIEELQLANKRKLEDMDRNYHNKFADVIDNQQNELDRYRKGIERTLISRVLKTVAGLYSEYEQYIKCDDAEKLKNGLRALLDELLQLLHENSVLEYKSTIGDKYSVKNCKVNKKLKTDDKEHNGTVVEILNTGFYVGNVVLVPERINIYVYDEHAHKELEE